jgi:XTP/dITP diphosphohydrolase
VSGGLLSIVLATKNRGKVAELRELLSGLPVDVVSLDEVAPTFPPVPEEGATFEENAVTKALAVAHALQVPAVADDSGLEVDALDGRPGVRSARFAGEGATDAENNAALLRALEGTDDDARAARFRCVMVLVDPLGDTRPILTEGSCEGRIAPTSQGHGGFGYDPLFLVEGTSRTFAELTDDEKNAISHRGKAARQMRAHIEALLDKRLAETLALASDEVRS